MTGDIKEFTEVMVEVVGLAIGSAINDFYETYKDGGPIPPKTKLGEVLSARTLKAMNAIIVVAIAGQAIVTDEGDGEDRTIN